VLEKFEFLRPEEVVGAEGELIEAFLGEALAGCEVGRPCWKRQKQEERVDRYATDIAEIFGQCSSDGSNFLVD
jgi:hypothetical protein